MMIRRNDFLQRVRQAVSEGNRAGRAGRLEPRGALGYQGAGSDPAARFREQLAAAGGQAYLVPDGEAAIAEVLELVQSRSARRILLGGGTLVDTLDLPGRLREWGCDVTHAASLSPDTSRQVFFAADLAITGVDCLVAETGTIVLSSRPDQPRSLSLLPPVHIALATRAQLVPDLFDLFEPNDSTGLPTLPSCLTLITGPSKTGDIELRLVTGVHGPGEVHVILAGE
jgi:L-lactate utilization protein LutC